MGFTKYLQSAFLATATLWASPATADGLPSGPLPADQMTELCKNPSVKTSFYGASDVLERPVALLNCMTGEINTVTCQQAQTVAKMLFPNFSAWRKITDAERDMSVAATTIHVRSKEVCAAAKQKQKDGGTLALNATR